MIIARPVGALDGLRALTFGSPEIFWEVAGHHKRTSATQNERTTRINIPARSISGVTYTEMAKIAILRFAILAISCFSNQKWTWVVYLSAWAAHSE